MGVATLAVAALPAEAVADASLSREDRGLGVRIYYDSSASGDRDGISGWRDETDFFFGPFGDEDIVAGPGCFSSGPFNPSFHCAQAPVEFDLGAGDDVLALGELAPTRVRAGAHADLIYNGIGSDDVRGGDGTDRFSYGGSASPLAAASDGAIRVTIDGIANDGEAGEGDNVGADVEVIEAGPENDTLIGDGASHTFIGGEGNDSIDSLNGAIDTLNCGAGADRANADPADVVMGCESVIQDHDRDSFGADDCNDANAAIHPGATEVADNGVDEDCLGGDAQDLDRDDDGVNRPADCNDSSGTVRPGATDVADNGIDEDCQGGDAQNLDRDGDGFGRPADCNDGNASIKPSAPERPRNDVDENCDGRDAPYPRIGNSVTAFWKVVGRRSRATRLTVVDAPFGSTIELRCRGLRCPLKRKRVRSQGVRFLQLTRLVKGRRFQAGSVLEVRVTMPDSVGKVVRFRMRRGHTPKPTTLCVSPRTPKPLPCGQVS